ncbi:MAG: hypothetical protein KIG73_03030 [Alphaproteobacteria bacterium]|nr:hypothetical protein [Alphaproteobacteria bacterium]
MSLRQDEKPLITFHTTPSAIDTGVDYLQHFDENEINKTTLRELCELMKRKAEELEKMATARTIKDVK